MKEKLYPFLTKFATSMPIDSYRRLTGQRFILPFYHTVSDVPAPHFSESGYFRTETDFRNDIDFFLKFYQPSHVGEFHKGGNRFHLTFDDGMSELYHVVFPILEKQKIPATLFVNSDFVDNKKMFASHKRSLLISTAKHSISSIDKISEYLSVEKNFVLKAIRSLNERKIDELAAVINLSFEDYLSQKKPYLSLQQLKELQKAGFTIGNHTKSHINLNKLDFISQKQQILPVNQFLKDNFDVKDFYFCFPYGDYNIDNQLFEWLFGEAGFAKSFGISGIKGDSYNRHYHRILMERDYNAEEIISAEYLYYLMKMPFNKNKIAR